MTTKRHDLATRRKVRFADLANPTKYRKDGLLIFYPQSAEIAMGVYQWLIANACQETKGGKLLHPGAFRALTGSTYHCAPHLPGTVTIDPRGWTEHLRGRFAEILHGREPLLQPMLRQLGVSLNDTRVVPVPYRVNPDYAREPDYCLAKRVEELYDYTGRVLRHSYNHVHPDAKVVSDVKILVGPQGYALDVHYSPPDSGSHWGVPRGGRKPRVSKSGRVEWNEGPMLTSRDGESFLDFVDRCHRVMQKLLVPSSEERWYAYSIAAARNDAGSWINGPILGYVLAPTIQSALDYWCEKYGEGKPASAFHARNVCGPCASFPADDLRRRCAIVVGGASEAGGAVGAIADGAASLAAAELLSNMARSPWRSYVHRNR